jgi:hypothetical protein
MFFFKGYITTNIIIGKQVIFIYYIFCSKNIMYKIHTKNTGEVL